MLWKKSLLQIAGNLISMLKIDQKYPQKYINIKKYLNATHKEEAHQLILFE